MLLNNFKFKIIFLLILFISATSRLYHLENIPSILSEKETLIGFTSYSIIKTGKDLIGKTPLLQTEGPQEKFFSLYSFLSLPLIAFFNLNQFSLRLLSAIFGICQVFLIYLMSKEFFKNIFSKQASKIGLIAAFFMAISPWNIFYSRYVSPENVSLTFFLAGLYFVIKKSHLIISLLLFTFSIFSWEGALILTPALMVTYFLLNSENKNKNKIIIFIGLIEIVCLLLTDQFNNLFTSTLFSGWGELNLPKKIIINFLDYFTAEFIFLNGDSRIKYWLVDLGVIYLFFLPFLFLGILFIFKEKKKAIKFFPFWILICFLYAAVGFNMRDVQRSLWASVPFQTIMAVGAYRFWVEIRIFKKIIHKIFLPGLLLIVFYNVLLFYHFYFVHFPQKNANEPEYAFKKTGMFLAQNYQYYDKVLIDSKYGDFYLYVLFYMKFPPKLFQLSDEKPLTFEKFYFGRVFQESLDPSSKTLLIVDKDKENLPQQASMSKIADFKSLNGDLFSSAWIF